MKFNKLKNIFIPHKGNNHKPHLYNSKIILIFALIIIIFELAFLTQVFLVFDKTRFLATVLPGVLTNITNDIRTENHIGILQTNSMLTQAAQLKANDMLEKQYFSHNTPDGKTPWYFFDKVGYKYKLAGENLAINFFESEEVSRAWMNSETHRANIIKSGYTEIGIAVAEGIYQGKNTIVVVQLFATPLKKIIEEKIETNSTQLFLNNKKNNKEINKEINTKIDKTVVGENTSKTSTKIEPVSTLVLGDASSSVFEVSLVFTKIKNSINLILTSPSKYMNSLLIVSLVLFAMALLLYIFVRSKIYHSAILVRGLGMVSIIFLLLYFNLNFINFETKVPTDLLQANVIDTDTGVAN